MAVSPCAFARPVESTLEPAIHGRSATAWGRDAGPDAEPLERFLDHIPAERIATHVHDMAEMLVKHRLPGRVQCSVPNDRCRTADPARVTS
jgi:hypothetical protein